MNRWTQESNIYPGPLITYKVKGPMNHQQTCFSRQTCTKLGFLKNFRWWPKFGPILRHVTHTLHH